MWEGLVFFLAELASYECMQAEGCIGLGDINFSALQD